MKNLILLLSVLSVISCTSPDDMPPTAERLESITGLWRLVSAAADGYTIDYIDCDTEVDGLAPDIGIYDFKADLNVEVFPLCLPDEEPVSTTYSYANNVLSIKLYNGVEWKAYAAALPDNRVKFDMFWNADEGDISGQSFTLKRTTMEEVEADTPN